MAVNGRTDLYDKRRREKGGGTKDLTVYFLFNDNSHRTILVQHSLNNKDGMMEVSACVVRRKVHILFSTNRIYVTYDGKNDAE